MAGSYNHAVTTYGKLCNSKVMNEMLENGGDVYEAIQEMYGMIWYLALGNANKVEEARENYKRGLAVSPGLQDEE